MARYQVKTDKDTGILNDPNAWSDDPRYIVNLVKRVAGEHGDGADCEDVAKVEL